jgi:CDP-paratose 2-epimerase
MKRILITGGAGFVGSSLGLKLREHFPEAEILALDNLYRKGSALNRARIEAGGLTFVQRDVRDRAAFELPPCDLIVDAAAEPSVLAGRGGDVSYVVDTNLGGTLNVLEAARKWSAAVLFLSTSRVYPVERLRAVLLEEGPERFEIAERQELPGIGPAGISEEFPLHGPAGSGKGKDTRTLYGATKFASEGMVVEYAAQFGVRTIVDRCGVLAGPWQMGRVDQGIVALWVAGHHYGKPLTYIGYDGKQVRDVLHVEDLADLVLRQLESRSSWDGRVYNVGGGRPASFSLRELTELTREAVGRSQEIVVDPTIRAGDVPLYITDASRVQADFGWKPGRSVEEIVRDTAEWIRGSEEELRPVFG